MTLKSMFRVIGFNVEIDGEMRGPAVNTVRLTALRAWMCHSCAAIVAMLLCLPVIAQECDEGWNPFISGGQTGVSGSVRALTVWNGDLIAAGSMTTAGGQTVNHIARWDGSEWHPFTFGGQVGLGGWVHSLTVWNGDLIAGGSFTTAGGQTVNHIARWDGSAWHAFTSGGQIGVNGGVLALSHWNGDLITGGSFTTAGGQSVRRIARWDGSAWHPLSSGGNTGLNDSVWALTVWNGDLVAGGGFTTAGNQLANRIARWDGSAWHPISSGMDDLVRALIVWNGDLVAGGGFTTAGNQLANCIARWDGSAWLPFISGGETGVDRGVRSLAVRGGDLVAGGYFVTAGGKIVNRVAIWHGMEWEAFISGGEIGVNSTVWSMTVWNGDLVVGFLTASGGPTANLISRWGVADGGLQYWTGPPGGGGSGNFHDSTNWFCGIVPSGVASVVLDSTTVPIPAAYTVALTSDVYARRIIARTDDVTLNLTNRNVYLSATHDDPWPSLIVGEYADEDVRLTVRNSLALPRRLYSGSLSIGDGEVSIGRLAVRNASPVSPMSAGLTAEGNITIGRLGSGTMIVENRADVVHGISESHLRIGDAAQGTLTVRTGGQLIGEDFIDTITIGGQPGASGTVTIDGVGSTWISASEKFRIGESGDASLTISSGGALYSATLGQLQLASNPGSTASVTITGVGSVWSEGIQAIVLGGSGEATINVTDGGMIESPNVNNFDGGTIAGDGFIVSNVFNLGTVKPGSNGSSNPLTIQGNYRQIGPPPGGALDEAGSLRISVGESGASRLHVTGTAELGGGLFVDLAPGANPALGQSFTALTAGSVDPQFDRFDVAFMPGLTESKYMRVNYDADAAAGSGGVTITIEELSTLLGFGDPESVDLDALPTDIAVGSFVHRDVLDIAVSLQGASVNDNGEVVVLYNTNGDGTVFTPVFYTVGRDPSALVVGDFNNNGSLDLAVANRQDNSVMILQNDGAGGFAVSEPIAAGVAPSGLVAADTRNIGVLDLAVASFGDDTVRILENDGSAGFIQVQSISVGQGPRGITAANLVSGLADLAVTNSDEGTVSLLENNGAGGYMEIAQFPSGSGAWQLSPADLDDDKDIDLIISNTLAGAVTILLSNGDGTFAPAVNLPVGVQAGSLAVWDINGDGSFPDVAVVTEDPDLGRIVRVLRNDTEAGGQLTFAAADALGENESPVLVATGDITGNSLNDLITINAATTIQGGQSGGRSGSGKTEATVTLRPNLTGDTAPGVASDLNGDGAVDVSDLLILLANWGPCPRGSSCPADLNGDGAVDVSDLLTLLADWG